MQATVDSYGWILLSALLLGHHLLTFHGTENHPFYRHELLPDKTLAAAGAQEAVCGCMPAEVVVGHSLHFRVDGIVASLTHLLGNRASRRGLGSDRVSHAGARGQTDVNVENDIKKYTNDSDVIGHHLSQQGPINSEQGDKQQVKGKQEEDASKVDLG